MILQKKIIIDYLQINDLYGYPKLYEYKSNNGLSFNCSPTSLRYVYHSLLILNHYKNNKNKPIVEVGCGYGGLFLAICHFSKLLNIEINHYYFIDLDNVGKLIKNYLDLNKSSISIEYSIHSANLHGTDIIEKDLFFISNYCFTEIDKNHRNNYITNLIPKCSSGFIIWQTCMGTGCDNIHDYIKLLGIKAFQEERPQTALADPNKPNYFVYL